MMSSSNTGKSGSTPRLARFAWLLDSSIPLPFGRSIGLDGIIGLIPGIGDAVGAALSSIIIFAAWRSGAPGAVLLRMTGNVAVESLVGTIPLVGDLFDFAFKANQRNVKLLQRCEQDARGAQRRSRWVIAATLAVALLFLVALLAAVTFIGVTLFQLLTGS